MEHEFSEQVRWRRQLSLRKEKPVPIRLPIHQIVSPEPHSAGPDFRKAWNLMPRWLQITLLLAFVLVGILVAIFIKG